MRGLLHYYFDGVMPFLQVSLGSCTLCSLSPAASLLVFTCAIQGGVGSRRWAPAQFALRPLLPAVLVFTCAIQGGVGNRHWAPAQFAVRLLLPAVLVFTCAIQGGVATDTGLLHSLLSVSYCLLC